jgi:hypothetical protein
MTLAEICGGVVGFLWTRRGALRMSLGCSFENLRQSLSVTASAVSFETHETHETHETRETRRALVELPPDVKSTITAWRPAEGLRSWAVVESIGWRAARL